MTLERSLSAPDYAPADPIAGRPGFRSFKTMGSIPYPQRWHRDLLIQATLDPMVEAIESVPKASIGGAEFAVDVLFVSRKRRILAVRDAPIGGIADPGTLLVSRSFVLSEPRCSVARQIWSSRKTVVSTGNRIRILAELARRPEGVALQRLIECIRADGAVEPADVVLALVCAGQAEIEIRDHLSPDTNVRLPRSKTQNPSKS